MPTLLIVCRDSALRRLVAGALAAAPVETVLAEDEEEALHAAFTLRLDGLLLDTRLMQGAGECLDGIFQVTGRLPVIFLAPARARWTPGMLPFDEELDRLLVEPFSPAELRSVVDTLPMRGRRSGLRIGGLEVDRQTHEARGQQGSALLTPMEFHILTYLAGKGPAPAGPAELLREVWGFPAGAGSTDVVRAHIKNLRAKLKAAGGDELIETLPGRGYRLPQRPLRRE